MEPFFPPSASLSTIVWVFVVFLAIFHGLFLFLFPLSKIGWKAVDYIWLAAASISIIAATAEVRKTTAAGYREIVQNHLKDDLNAVRSFAASYATGSTFCSPRTKAASSPPNFDAIVAEQQASCAWFAGVHAFLGTIDPGHILTGDQLPAKPHYTLTDLKKIDAEFIEVGTQYNKTVMTKVNLESDAQRSHEEETLLMVAPYLLAIALALRVTKVTGEIRIDCQAQRSATASTPSVIPVEVQEAEGPATPTSEPVEATQPVVEKTDQVDAPPSVKE